ncbi:MAG: hypothetical protein WCX97_03810 [Candidatus Magasanikbacteria bacterium]
MKFELRTIEKDGSHHKLYNCESAGGNLFDLYLGDTKYEGKWMVIPMNHPGDEPISADIFPKKIICMMNVDDFMRKFVISGADRTRANYNLALVTAIADGVRIITGVVE